MRGKPEFIVVLITTDNEQEARKIAQALLEQKKAACVNRISGVNSTFWWEGKLDMAQETMLIAKTRASLLPELITLVKGLHSYRVPEIIALPIIGGNPAYLEWMNEVI